MKWRKLIIATHRDVGYLLAGMTVIYAISGVAVNHVDDWNPNYVVRTETVELGEGRRAYVWRRVYRYDRGRRARSWASLGGSSTSPGAKSVVSQRVP